MDLGKDICPGFCNSVTTEFKQILIQQKQNISGKRKRQQKIGEKYKNFSSSEKT